ncbi:hypothetical protein QS460_00770 [Liquorilactobacillus mali]|uniref:beta strand repeat-containing protein n=1 Tax=Liquorilactobacillus mali TaxID=1618 RepID=UPI0026535FA5|nr:hypothetical protein [Liquorilactobacillus mali]MDN7144450.1 hypothetical protein [Liquorilactobacillus mali]
MLTQSDAAIAAWRATERTLDAKVSITDNDGNTTDYATTDVTSIAYDAGAFTGDTFSIGSTYENNMTVTFAHLVEGLQQGYKVTAEIGIKLPDGTFEYCPLGVFIISDDISMDRNNDITTIKCYDQFCAMEGTYTSSLTYPAKVVDVIAEIANNAGVELNTDDIARLPTQGDVASAISGQTYRVAIGWIAQFYGGFALFDRDGKLTIRTVASPDYILDPSQYEQSGLTKNEATYVIGGLSVSVTTTTTDSTGESSENTSTLTAGSTSGSQIELTNNLMTQSRLDDIWTGIKDITFYPFELTWFGNPAIEAGDWLTLEDTKGNKFNVPNNAYTMTFDGGLTATSKADQTSTASSSYSYSGTLTQTVKELSGRQGATGNYIYGPDTIQTPVDAKIGDLWYKQNGNKVELWQYQRQSDGTGEWVLTNSDTTGVEISENVATAMADVDTAKQNANTAVETANTAISKAQIAIDSADDTADQLTNVSAVANQAKADSATSLSNSATAMSNATTALSTADSALSKSTANSSSITTINTSIDDINGTLSTKANQTDLDKLTGRVTTSETNITQNTKDIALKANTSDVNTLASRVSTAESAITVNANAIALKANTTDVNTLTGRVSTAESAITVNANAINTKVSSSDVQNMLTSGGYATQTWTTTQINTTASGINATISNVQTQVANSAVGTNLLLNTSDYSDNWTWSVYPTIDKSQTPNILHYPSTTVSDGQTSDIAYQVIGSILQPSTTYTASFYAKGTGSFLFYCHPSVSSVSPQDNRTLITLTSNYKLYTITFTTSSNISGSKNLRLRSDYNTTGGTTNTVEAYIYGLKLEKGAFATDWSANPADNATVTAVTNLSATVDGLGVTVSKKVDNDTFTSYQTQVANALVSKVESSDFNSYKTQTDSAIQSKVNSSDYNTEVTQLNSVINSKVSQTDWSNSAVGANLVSNSNADTSQIAWGNTNLAKHSFYNGGQSYLFVIHNTTTSEVVASSPRFFITAGETYTLSFKAFNNGLLTNADVWLLGRAANNTTDNYTVAQQLVKSVKFSTAGIQYYTVTFTVASGIGNAYLRFDNNATSTSGSSADLYFNEVKVELGSIATPWCPAASEIANYSQVQQLSDNINLRVQKNDVINQINVSSEGILIDGAKVHITGTTTIDDAVITNAMVSSLSASKLTAGTIDASLINVINLNANNISTGTITGVTFHQTSSGHDTVIDSNGINDYDSSGNHAVISKGKLQVYDSSNQGFFMAAGSLQLTSKNAWDSSSSVTYGAIQRNQSLFNNSLYGMELIGTAGLLARTSNSNFTSINTSTLTAVNITGSGLGFSQSNGISLQSSGLFQSFAGNTYKDTLTYKPTFVVGSNGTDEGTAGTSILALAENIYLKASTSGNVEVKAGGLVVSNGGASIAGGLSVGGAFKVSGSKNAIVETSKGWTLINAYETAEYYFGDIAKVNTGSGSKVKVMMDSLFLETVNTNVDYHVFVSSYGNGYAWVSEQGKDYFIIESNVPNLEVSYEVKAKRLGYENTRLEIDENFGKEVA